MNTRNLCFSAATLVFAMSVANAATTWNAAADFVTNHTLGTPTTNPNQQVPAWSYGYRDNILNTTITLYAPGTYVTSVSEDSNIRGWQSGFMVAAANVSTVSSSGLNPGEMIVHPQDAGINPTYNVIRWTAPSSGTYDISATWTALSLLTGSGRDGVDVNIVVNGVGTYSGSSAFGVTANSGIQSLVLAAGAHVDFVTGPGLSGNDDSDTTRFNATITLVPEPSSALLMGAAIPLLFRRRRTAVK